VRQLRAAISRAEPKFSMRDEFGARSVSKISPLVAARSANQSSLIRSFLIDSGRSEAFCEAICKKNFCLCIVTATRDADANSNAHARNSCCGSALTTPSRCCKKSLFHRPFCDVGELASTMCVAFVACAVALRLRCVNDRSTRGNRAGYTFR